MACGGPLYCTASGPLKDPHVDPLGPTKQGGGRPGRGGGPLYCTASDVLKEPRVQDKEEDGSGVGGEEGPLYCTASGS